MAIFFRALSDVMLLKPSQFTKLARNHFGDSVLSDWHKQTVQNLLDNNKYDTGTSFEKELDDIVYVGAVFFCEVDFSR